MLQCISLAARFARFAGCAASSFRAWWPAWILAAGGRFWWGLLGPAGLLSVGDKVAARSLCTRGHPSLLSSLTAAQLPRRSGSCALCRMRRRAAGSAASAAMSPAAGRPASRGTRAVVPAAKSGSRPAHEKMAFKGNSGRSAAKLLPGVRNGIYRRENAPKWLIWAPMRPPKIFGRRRPHTSPAGVFGLVFIDTLAFLLKKQKPPPEAATGRQDPSRPPCTELYTKISPGALSILTKPPGISFSLTAAE